MYAEEEDKDRGLVPEEKPEPVLDINQLIPDNDQDSNVAYAATKDPDKHSKDLETAKRAQVNPALVEQDEEFTQQRAKQNDLKLNLDQLYENNHRVTATQTLADRDNLAVSQDDIGSLSELETWAQLGGDFSAGVVGDAVGMPLSGIGEMVSAFQNDYIDEPLLAIGVPEEFLRRDPEKQTELEKNILWAVDIGNHLKTVGSAVKATSNEWRTPAEQRTYLNEYATGLGQMAGMVGITIASGGTASVPLMFGMGADMQADSMREQGLEPDFLTLAGGGVITAMSEKIGLDKVMNFMPKGVKSRAIEVMTEALKAGGVEALSEVVENIGHSFLEYFRYNKNVKFLEGAAEEAEVAFGVGGTMNLLLNLLAPKRGKTHFTEHDREQERLDSFIQILQKSQLKERNPEILRMHLQNLGQEYGIEENVYIPAEDAQEALQELSLDQSLPEIQEIYKQLPDALKIGGDIVIPIEDFAKHFTDTEVVEKIRDHVRMSATGLTRAEAGEVAEEERQALLDTMKKAVEAQEQKNEAQNVMDSIYEELKDTGQVSSRGARLNARMMASYVATKAERSGMSVTEVFEAMNLRIQGEEHQGILPDSGLLLAQDFGDIEFEEKGRTTSSGKNVKVKRKAQALWNRAVKRHDQAIKLRDCLYG